MAPSHPVIKADPDEEDVVMHASDTDIDEVVREIDVLLSPALASQLYLMQFPLQHNSVQLPEAARIKAEHNMIELDEAIPQNAGNDGNFSMDQRTHTSHVIPVTSHMCLGKMSESGDQLNLVPLSHITQMRPSFAHVDEQAAKNGDNNIDNMEVVDVKQEEPKLEKKPVMLQKKETERAAIARKSSFAYKKASQDSEAWRMLIVCGPDTPQHEQANSQIECPSPSTPLVVSSATSDDDASAAFVHSLNYLPPAIHDVDTDTPISHLSSLCAQLTVALQRGWPVPWNVIKNQFSNVDDQDLWTALSSCAILVRGNFVLQSRLLPSLSRAVQQARTFILFLLQRVGHVERSRLQNALCNEGSGITADAIEMLLNQVATRGHHGGWQSKIQDNLELYELFPEQTQLHTQYWERQETRFADWIRLYNEQALD